MRWLAVLAVLAVGGCSSDLASFGEQRDIRARWDAQNVYPNNYKNDLLAFLRTYLNNPEHIRDAALASPQMKSVGPGERFVACVRYNARDSDGRYKGVKDGVAVYVSGKLDQFIDQPKAALEICKDAAYTPFPELAALRR